MENYQKNGGVFQDEEKDGEKAFRDVTQRTEIQREVLQTGY